MQGCREYRGTCLVLAHLGGGGIFACERSGAYRCIPLPRLKDWLILLIFPSFFQIFSEESLLQSSSVFTRLSPVLHTSPFFSTWYLRLLSANNRSSPLPSMKEFTEIPVRRREVSLFEYLVFDTLILRYKGPRAL